MSDNDDGTPNEPATKAETMIRQALKLFIGDGLPSGTGSDFAIWLDGAGPLENDFWIAGPAYCLVEGLLAFNETHTLYTRQPGGFEPLTVPVAEDALAAGRRIDLVYLTASLVDEDGTRDAGLLHPVDVGTRTSLRKRINWLVRVHEGLTRVDVDWLQTDDGGERRKLNAASIEISLGRLTSLPSLARKPKRDGARVALALLFREVGSYRVDVIEDVRSSPLAVYEVKRRAEALERLVAKVNSAVQAVVQQEIPAIKEDATKLWDHVKGPNSLMEELINRGIFPLLAPEQDYWRKCKNCLGLFNEWDRTHSVCPSFPGGGGHDSSGSRNYSLFHSRSLLGGRSDGWLCCYKCRGLVLVHDHDVLHPCASGVVKRARSYTHGVSATSRRVRALLTDLMTTAPLCPSIRLAAAHPDAQGQGA